MSSTGADIDAVALRHGQEFGLDVRGRPLRTERSSSTGLSRATTSPAGAGPARAGAERFPRRDAPTGTSPASPGASATTGRRARPGSHRANRSRCRARGCRFRAPGRGLRRAPRPRQCNDTPRCGTGSWRPRCALGGKCSRHHRGCRLALGGAGAAPDPFVPARAGAPTPVAGSPRSAAWNCAWSHVIPPAPTAGADRARSRRRRPRRPRRCGARAGSARAP